MSELTLECQLKQLNERHMEYAAGLHAKIDRLERELEAAKKSAMRANAKYVNATWSESERNKAASDDYMSLVSLYEKEVALSDRLIVAGANALQGYNLFSKKLSDEWDAACTAYRKARGME